jgi:hypothetical protein
LLPQHLLPFGFGVQAVVVFPRLGVVVRVVRQMTALTVRFEVLWAAVFRDVVQVRGGEDHHVPCVVRAVDGLPVLPVAWRGVVSAAFA